MLSQLVSCGLLETLKFSVLELQEHLDTYNGKREAAEHVSRRVLKPMEVMPPGQNHPGVMSYYTIIMCKNQASESKVHDGSQFISYRNSPQD